MIRMSASSSQRTSLSPPEYCLESSNARGGPSRTGIQLEASWPETKNLFSPLYPMSRELERTLMDVFLTEPREGRRLDFFVERGAFESDLGHGVRRLRAGSHHCMFRARSVQAA
jgi:hypothetical protein